jgi:hypothetical protein
VPAGRGEILRLRSTAPSAQYHIKDSMHDHFSHIDTITNIIESEFGDMTKEQLNQKPNPQAWSIAQILEHLIIINSTYFPIIHALNNGTYTIPFIGKLTFIPTLLGKALLKSMKGNRRQKTKTFPIWEPSHSEIEADIIQRFRQHQEELKHMIVQCEHHIKAHAIISSPANKYLVYPLSMAIHIIIAHEYRHIEQAREVASQFTITT